MMPPSMKASSLLLGMALSLAAGRPLVLPPRASCVHVSDTDSLCECHVSELIEARTDGASEKRLLLCELPGLERPLEWKRSPSKPDS